MALSTVGLLGLLALQMIAIRGNMMSRNFGEAIGIAQQRLESAAHTQYASLATLVEGPQPTCLVAPGTGSTPNISPTQDTASPQAIYSRCTVVTANADNTTDVRVKIYWNDTNGTQHSVELDTKRSP